MKKTKGRQNIHYKLPEPPDTVSSTEFKSTLHNGSMRQILGLINTWINDSNDETKTQEFINHCQVNYQNRGYLQLKITPNKLLNKMTGLHIALEKLKKCFIR